MQLYDVVELTVDRPDDGLRSGAVGTIVDAYTNDEYEVEFADGDGRTIALAALHADQLRPHG